jgi:hypothetical protein
MHESTSIFVCVPPQSRVMAYLTQLAIITPYAQFDLRYICQATPARSFKVRYESRCFVFVLREIAAPIEGTRVLMRPHWQL